MTLGQRISGYRKALGVSQEELGARLGVSRQAVSKWETGAAAPDMENLLALAREFGVSVAELTATPEPPVPAEAPAETSGGPTVSPPHRRRRWAALALILAVLAVLVLAVPVLLLLGLRTQTEPPDLTTEPAETGGQSQQAADLPETDFSLLWTGDGGRQEFLELGGQDNFFPYGTSLVLTEPEEVLDTDDSLTTLHRADCGDLHLEYLHTGYDPEQDPEAPEQEFITKITTIVPGYTTPCGIGVGDTKEDVLRSYGDELVYCLKEQGGYTLVKHDYYYAFQTPETFGQSLCLYMRDGLVAGIKLEHMLDAGNTAYAPNNVSIFPLVNGEPDFSARQEPEREEISDTRRVYIAWNRLVTDSNLSAEERYACRRDVFSLLPNMDWGELRQMGSAENPDDAIFGLMTWLEEQDPYSSAEILWLQMGCTAQGLDGAYTEGYCRILSRALFSDPVTFSKSLATDGVDEAAKSSALHLTAYDADLYPADLKNALDTLDAALADNSFTDAERGWAELLRLYLTTPLEARGDLPASPAELV